MNRTTLEAALRLSHLWKVTDATFSIEEKRLDITIDFKPGCTFSCPVCGAEGAKACDAQERTWFHLNFFQHETYLHAEVLRVECPRGCGFKTVETPWTRSRNGFIALFEALIIMAARGLWRPLQQWWASAAPAYGVCSTIMLKKPAGRRISLKCSASAWMKRPAVVTQLPQPVL